MGASDPAASDPPAAHDDTGLDIESLLSRIHYDRDGLTHLTGLLFMHLPGRLAALRQAVEAGDAGAIERAAHALRGSVANFTVGPAWQLAGQLEHQARSGDLRGVEGVHAALELAAQQLLAALQRWLDDEGR